MKRDRIRILLVSAGSIETWLNYDGMYHCDVPGKQQVKIFTSIEKVIPGTPATYFEMPPMVIDHTTLVPVVDVQGNPVMEERVISGQNGLETIQVQKTISEYNKVFWDFFDKRNPDLANMQAEIEEGMKRRSGLSSKPYVFIRTQAFIDSQL